MCNQINYSRETVILSAILKQPIISWSDKKTFRFENVTLSPLYEVTNANKQNGGVSFEDISATFALTRAHA